MARPVTNHELDRLLIQAGYEHAHGAFARQINHLGRDHGALRYDAASVYWWLRGRRPDRPVQSLIAEVLSRKLNRPVPVDALGFGDGDDRLGLSYPATVPDAVDTVTSLWRMLGHRRDFAGKMPFVASASIEAGFAWRFDPRDIDISRTGQGRVTEGDIAALRLCVDQFVDLDRCNGGGSNHVRAFVANFLHRQVTPMLHGTYTDVVGRQLLNTAAALTGQVAFMSYDAGEHGVAERHFITGLRLAKAADDQLYGAHLLANMATQAVFLGQVNVAVRLARAAVEGAGRAPAGVLARLYTAEACAHAVAGDRVSCTRALRRAEVAVARAAHTEAPAWVSYFTPAHWAGAALRCFRDLRLYREALRHANAALDLSNDSNRTRALHTALIATTHAAAGNYDAAGDLGVRALDLSERVESRRVQQRIADLTARLTPHRGVPSVACFLERVDAMPTSA